MKCYGPCMLIITIYGVVKVDSPLFRSSATCLFQVLLGRIYLWNPKNKVWIINSSISWIYPWSSIFFNEIHYHFKFVVPVDMLCLINVGSWNKVCKWLATGLWFSPGTPVSSTNKTGHHDIAEILLKVTLNTITQPTSNCTYGIDSDVVHSVCEPLKVRLIFPHMARCNGYNYVIGFFFSYLRQIWDLLVFQFS